MSVKPLNIDEHLGKVKNRVSLVGVELEGGWANLPPGVQALEHDASVFARRAPAGAPHIGELPIGPMAPAALESQVTKHYPNKINATCGMHIHMSFDTLYHYGLLMVEEYQETILHYLTEWAKEKKFKENHHIWARLRGESQYCMKGFWPDIQASTKRKSFDRGQGHRYTVIHYCGRYHTVECRVLPMMNKPALAVEAIHKVIDITNACIYVLGRNKKAPSFNSKIELPGGIVYEESLETNL